MPVEPRRATRYARLPAVGLAVAALVGCTTLAPTATPSSETPSATPVTITALPTAPAAAAGATSEAAPEATSTAAGGTAATGPDLPRLDELTGPLEPGTYRHVLDGLGYEADPPVLELTVPEGWSVLPVGSLLREDEGVTISFWNVAQVFADPCRWHGERQLVGPGIRDLAQALQRVPGRNSSEPVEVELDGRWGLFMQWSVPADLESDRPGSFVGCDDTRTGDTIYVSWTTWPNGRQRYHRFPGEVDRMWILDVDGRRLLIDAQQEPAATPDAVAEIDAVIASIRFVG
ncbi:MAG: hypothetical protein WCA30_15515 [Dermatophilaceae bacterium]